VELSDGLFAPDTNEVIVHKLNPIFGGTQASIAGRNLGQSLLRLFHPTPSSTLVSRSYFVDDVITNRGTVQYSFGLVFMREASERFLSRPQRAFELSAFEPYEEFIKRVTEEGSLTYSGKYDPRPEDYNKRLDLSREAWVRLGFNEKIFIDFFNSLGMAIGSQKGDSKVAVMLPEGRDGEALIFTVLSILPPWLRRKFGAASRWAGSAEGSSAAALDGMQLVCYVGEKPPHDTTAAVIDLTGAGQHRNIEPVTEEQLALAKWYWENIESQDALEAFEGYMLTRYKQLMDKMPFAVFAHCFWLWLTFHENIQAGLFKIEDLTFSMAARAITSLAIAFGRNIDEHFTNLAMLNSIFKTYESNLDGVPASDVSAATVHAICSLASVDVEIKLGGLKTRDLVKPLFDKFYSAGEWTKLELILQYYAKIIKDGKPEDRLDAEAIVAFMQALESPSPKIADESAIALTKYSSIIVSLMMQGAGNRMDVYRDIALLLKGVGRQMNIDVASLENAPKNEASSRMFFEIEKFNRMEIANLRPPGKKQLESLVSGLQFLSTEERGAALRELLGIYWTSDELKDKTQMRKYIEYLRENKLLSLYLQCNVGAYDVREFYGEALNMSFDVHDPGATVDKRIDDLSRWYHMLREECGFPDSDPIFEHFNSKFNSLNDAHALCETMSSKAGRHLAAMLRERKLDDMLRPVELINKIDEIGENGGEFSSLLTEWENGLEVFKLRIGYWCSRVGNVPAEWALSNAIIIAASEKMPVHRRTAEVYLNTKQGPRGHAQDLKSLYEALGLICDDYRYGRELALGVYESIREGIGKIIGQLRQVDSLEVLIETADDFRMLHRLYQSNDLVQKMGKEISDEIKAVYRERKQMPPAELLQKFNRLERHSVREGPGGMEPLLLTIMHVVLLIGAACCVVLLAGGDGLIATLYAVLPTPVIIAMAVCALATVALSVLELLRQLGNRGRY